jgi:hypothetical protein
VSAHGQSGGRKRPCWTRPGPMAGACGLAGLVALSAALAWKLGDPIPLFPFANAAQDRAVAPAAASEEKIKIVFQTVPPVKAEVLWGKRRLGFVQGPRKPLIVERPRDSGPLDILVRAAGYLPVNTRAYTFSDTRVTVRLTPVAEKHTLFGYRQELPDAGADAGGTTAAPTAPAPTPAPAPAPAPAPPPTFGPAPPPKP